MKKYILSLAVMMMTMLTSANAMSYEQAREQALFLTDKMAYELNLNESQYEAAYEINLDYLMSVNTYDDLYAACWTRRNLDLSYILYDWQYSAFCAASYFYRPLWWEGGVWHFGIYARYPHRDYFYFGRPHFYVTYRGGHAWRLNGGRSWYHHNYVRANTSSHIGMRDNIHKYEGVRGNVGGRNSSGRTNGAIGRNGIYNRDRGNATPQRGNVAPSRSTTTPQRGNVAPRTNVTTPNTTSGNTTRQGTSVVPRRTTTPTVRPNASSAPIRQSSTRVTATRPSSSSISSSTPSVSRSSSSMSSSMSRGGSSMRSSAGSARSSHGGRR